MLGAGLFWLFIFGSAVGSFLNVVILRYDPERFLFGRQILGRSHCLKCGPPSGARLAEGGRTLRWFELIPIVSFVIQRGRCLHCKASLSVQYPLVEILSGLIFVLVPLEVKTFYFFLSAPYLAALSLLWVLVFLALLVVLFIDLRLSIIPDEANIFLGILGALIAAINRPYFGPVQGSFLGAYSLMFGFRENLGVWYNHFLAAFVAGALFAFIILITRGRGMGIGDLKLAIPLGLVFGWPDTIFILSLSFVIGSIFGVYAIVRQGKNLKSAVPFGPFLVSASALVFFFGEKLVGLYFQLFNF